MAALPGTPGQFPSPDRPRQAKSRPFSHSNITSPIMPPLRRGFKFIFLIDADSIDPLTSIFAQLIQLTQCGGEVWLYGKLFPVRDQRYKMEAIEAFLVTFVPDERSNMCVGQSNKRWFTVQIRYLYAACRELSIQRWRLRLCTANAPSALAMPSCAKPNWV